MARFGKLPVIIPEAVKVGVGDGKMSVSGAKGTITRDVPREIEVVVDENEVAVKKVRGGKSVDMLQGTYRSHLINMIKGVTEGWEKSLEIVGAGYRAVVEKNNLVLTIGYSHPVVVSIPEGIDVAVEKSTIKVVGADKEVVGHLAALIRSKREPEPYKGAGIRYQDEEVRRKAGKQAAKTEGA